MAERKCVTLTLMQKRKLIRHKHDNPTMLNTALAAWATRKFKASVSNVTVGRILKVANKLLIKASTSGAKQIRVAENADLEALLYQWFLGAQEEKLCINDDLLLKKAKKIYEVMQQTGEGSFKFSNSWLYNFKKRRSISCRVVHGEGGSLQLTEDTWDQIASLKARLTDYEPEDIFNFDETTLFYKLQPNMTLQDQITMGEKKLKERLSIGLIANLTGTVKFPPLVINWYKRPRAFSSRNIKFPESLGILWYSNRKAWMNTEVFQDYLEKFDAFLHKKGRKKVVLLVDNASSHKWLDMVEKLKVTRVLPLPPNTTAKFQPMDAGIVKSFKAQYRRLMMKKMLEDYDKGKKVSLDVYDAVTMVESAWSKGVTKATIENCWIHTGLARHIDDRSNKRKQPFDLNAPLDDSDLAHLLDCMQDAVWDLSIREDAEGAVEVNMSAVNWVEVDQADPDDLDGANKWLDSVLQNISDGPEGEIEPDLEELDEPINVETLIQFLEAKAATVTIQKYLEQAPIEVFDLLQKLKVVEDWMTGEHQSRITQTTRDSFFKLNSDDQFNVAGYGTLDLNA